MKTRVQAEPSKASELEACVQLVFTLINQLVVHTCSLVEDWAHIQDTLLLLYHGTFYHLCLREAGSLLAPSDPNSGQTCFSPQDHLL